MKHILCFLTVALLGVAAPVFAEAEFFDVIETPYTNEDGQGEGNGSYYTIKMKSAGSVYITNLINNTGSPVQDEELTNPDYGLVKYGYVDSDKVVHPINFSDAKTKEFDYFEYNKYKDIPDRFYRVGYYLGDFEAEDEFEIYLATANASVASNSPTGEYISRYMGRGDANDPTLHIGQLYLGTQINFGIIAQGIGDGSDSNGGGTFGTPLPGGLQIALISGLFALGFWYIRRRKAIAG